MAQWQQVQKSQRMKRSFVTQVFSNFMFERLDIREDVAMRNYDSARLCGSTGCEDDFQPILTGERRRTNRHGIVFLRDLLQGFQRERWNCAGGSKEIARSEKEFRGALL